MNILEKYKVIFWDFDGVIKKSNKIKIDAFHELFKNSPNINKILEHHLQNQGISRFDKIPLYLQLSSKELSKINIEKYTNRFSEIVVEKVINSEWVEGALDLIASLNNQKHVIVTGTPQDEMEMILQELKIKNMFYEVHGSPKKKSIIIHDFLKRNNYENSMAIMIGDAHEDQLAANKNGIDFYLVMNEFNQELDKNLCTFSSCNFLHI